jgi:hypothetical protein
MKGMHKQTNKKKEKFVVKLTIKPQNALIRLCLMLQCSPKTAKKTKSR